ncbi:DUF4395 domain-containing protein [Actinotalea sp. C106]|uniref:DUF4395 domain-containing protein n=1 Tax=Actinotalea sp. C106 TaxID=2908644 RepID=UPI00254257DA|nr:DUF4395 domain-containing protein [Actinotalea sp. C106]
MTETGIDPRGPRFGAAVMAGLLVVTLLLGAGPAATAALAVAALLFALGAARGAQGSLQGMVFARWVRPRLRPTSEREDPRPPRFAQVVGLVITGTGVVLGVLGLDAAVPVAAGVALVAAFLNAAFGFCLGCEMYVLGRRVLHRA